MPLIMIMILFDIKICRCFFCSSQCDLSKWTRHKPFPTYMRVSTRLGEPWADIRSMPTAEDAHEADPHFWSDYTAVYLRRI